MSHFVCEYKTESTDNQVLSRIMLDAVPADKRDDNSRLGGTCSYFVSYGTDKVIPDVFIKKDNSDTWLAVVGTPLLRFKDKESEQEFLNGFLASPKEFLRHKIDGNFALFCYDFERKRFIAATDLNNTIPIFYTVTPNGIYFSSHELILAKFVKAEINPFGFAQAVHLGITLGDTTRFKNILKVLPCQILIIDHDMRTHFSHYWKPEEEKPVTDSFDKLMINWLELLSDSVKKFYESGNYTSFKPDLTGGEDSRLLVAQCHSLGIPFEAEVVGSSDHSDVKIALQAAREAGVRLKIKQNKCISQEDLLANAPIIILQSDAYQGLVDSCNDWATKRAYPLDDFRNVKFCGVGGEEFRGTYYLRGKAFFPSRKVSLDYKFFTKFKYLLDYHHGLLKYPDKKFTDSVYGIIYESMQDVKEFPIGTQVDHLLRMFQTCFMGMKYKVPLYLPFMTRDLIRSIYYIPPQYKQGGRLTRACTEILYPDLAFIKTQKGVPTIRMTVSRLPLFVPEYFYLLKSIRNGFESRFFKWKQPRPLLSMEKNEYIFTTILNSEPYVDWFASSRSMVTGWLYNADALNSILKQAKAGLCKNVPILGRIVSLELACRWVYQKGL